MNGGQVLDRDILGGPVKHAQGSVQVPEAAPASSSRAPAPAGAPRKGTVDVDRLYRMAKEADKRGDLKRSEDLLETARLANPRNGRVWRRLARLAQERGDAERARLLLQAALQHLPEEPYLWQAFAELERRSGDAAAAKKCFRRALSFDPSMAAALHGLAKLELAEGAAAESERLMGAAIKQPKNARNARLYHQLAIARSQLGDRDGAVAALREGVRRCCRRGGAPNAHLLCALGAELFAACEAGDVVPCFGAESAEAQLQSAEKALDAATKSHPGLAQAWIALARVRRRRGGVEASRRTYAEGVASCSRMRSRCNALWQSWATLEESAAKESKDADDSGFAAAVYARAAEACPADARLLVRWSKWERRCGRRHLQKTLLEKALLLSTKAPEGEAPPERAEEALRRLLGAGAPLAATDAAPLKALGEMYMDAACEARDAGKDRIAALCVERARSHFLAGACGSARGVPELMHSFAVLEVMVAAGGLSGGAGEGGDAAARRATAAVDAAQRVAKGALVTAALVLRSGAEALLAARAAGEGRARHAQLAKHYAAMGVMRDARSAPAWEAYARAQLALAGTEEGEAAQRYAAGARHAFEEAERCRGGEPEAALWKGAAAPKMRTMLQHLMLQAEV